MDEIFYKWVPYVLGLLTVYFGYHLLNRYTQNAKENQEETVIYTQKQPVAKKSVKNVPKLKKFYEKKEIKDTYTHPWHAANLKGHCAEIFDMDYNPNGKFIATCGNDRTILLWTITANEKNPKLFRQNVEYDDATCIKWSPDTKAFIASLASTNTVQVYKLVKKKDGSFGSCSIKTTFPDKHNAEIIHIGVACNGLFIITCSSDTTIIVWDLKGNVLATIDTLHMSNNYACISPCGRYIGSSGFTPDVKVWEVCFLKTGEFKEVKRVYVLKGHTSGVLHFSFSNDSSRMLSVSKDKTWKLWDTNIEYSKGQEPYLLKSCEFIPKPKAVTALSPDGRTVCLATASDIYFYSSITGDLQAKLDNIHPDPIKVVQFSPDGHFLAAAAGRHVRIFHNLPGYQNVILDLETTKKGASSPLVRERLLSQIEEAKSQLQILKKKFSHNTAKKS